jgi:hypothetical protein
MGALLFRGMAGSRTLGFKSGKLVFSSNPSACSCCPTCACTSCTNAALLAKTWSVTLTGVVNSARTNHCTACNTAYVGLAFVFPQANNSAVTFSGTNQECRNLSASGNITLSCPNGFGGSNPFVTQQRFELLLYYNCGATSVFAGVYLLPAGHSYLTIQLDNTFGTSGGGTALWGLDITGQLDCNSVTNLPVPFVSQAGTFPECDYSGSSALVSFT